MEIEQYKIYQNSLKSNMSKYNVFKKKFIYPRDSLKYNRMVAKLKEVRDQLDRYLIDDDLLKRMKNKEISFREVARIKNVPRDIVDTVYYRLSNIAPSKPIVETKTLRDIVYGEFNKRKICLVEHIYKEGKVFGKNKISLYRFINRDNNLALIGRRVVSIGEYNSYCQHHDSPEKIAS